MRATATCKSMPASVPFEVPSHAGPFTVDGQPCRLLVWTEAEWARLPEHARPKDALPFEDGFGRFAFRHQG